MHLGNLIVDEGDLHGDGVNVAARLQAKAPPGSTVISNSVRDFVGERVKARFVDIRGLTLRNIERPVQAFEVKWVASDWEAWRLCAVVGRRAVGAQHLQDDMVERDRTGAGDPEPGKHDEVGNLLEAEKGFERIDVAPFCRDDRDDHDDHHRHRDEAGQETDQQQQAADEFDTRDERREKSPVPEFPTT